MAVSMNPAMMDATLSEEQMIQMVEQFEVYILTIQYSISYIKV